MPRVGGRHEEWCPTTRGRANDLMLKLLSSCGLGFLSSGRLSPWCPSTLTSSSVWCSKCFNNKHRWLGSKACFCLNHRSEKISKREASKIFLRKGRLERGDSVSSRASDTPKTPCKGHQNLAVCLLPTIILSLGRQNSGSLASSVVPLISSH